MQHSRWRFYSRVRTFICNHRFAYRFVSNTIQLCDVLLFWKLTETSHYSAIVHNRTGERDENYDENRWCGEIINTYKLGLGNEKENVCRRGWIKSFRQQLYYFMRFNSETTETNHVRNANDCENHTFRAQQRTTKQMHGKYFDRNEITWRANELSAFWFSINAIPFRILIIVIIFHLLFAGYESWFIVDKRHDYDIIPDQFYRSFNSDLKSVNKKLIQR